MISRPIVTSCSAFHPKKSAAASEIRSSAQTNARNPKNHLLYRNFLIACGPIDAADSPPALENLTRATRCPDRKGPHRGGGKKFHFLLIIRTEFKGSRFLIT